MWSENGEGKSCCADVENTAEAVFPVRLGGCRHTQKHPWASVGITIVEGRPNKEFSGEF